MTFVRVCGADELEEDTPKRVELDGTPISVVRTEGEVFAIHDICSHANVSSPRRGRRLPHRVLAARLALRPPLGQADSLPATRPVPVYP